MYCRTCLPVSCGNVPGDGRVAEALLGAEREVIAEGAVLHDVPRLSPQQDAIPLRCYERVAA
jgi:hypothetical protein